MRPPMKTRTALVIGITLAAALLATATPVSADHDDGKCQRVDGGMDHGTYLCIDTSDPKCPVYTVTYTDRGADKRCFGVL